MSKQRGSLIATLLLCVLAATTACHTAMRPRPGVWVVEEPTMESILSVHGSPRPVLVVHGRRYDAVQGCWPYYVEVPGTDSIVFVTSSSSQQDEIHLADIKRRLDTVIKLPASDIGHFIGCTDNWRNASALLLNPNTLVITYSLSEIRKTWRVDLASKSVEWIDLEQITNGVTNRWTIRPN